MAIIAYSSPFTWPAGYLVNAADFNTQIRDQFLAIAGTNGVFPSPHMTSPTVDSGGLVISAGNITVVPTVAASSGITISGIAQAQGTFAMGIFQNLSLQAAVNGDQLYGALIQPVFLPNSKTNVAVYAARLIPGAVAGAAFNCGLQIDAPSGGTTSNTGLIVAGGAPAILVQAGGITISAGGLTVSAGNTHHGPGELTGNAGSSGMTTGFIWIPGANAAPTGTPTAGFTGRAPMYYDSNLKRLNIWDGTWRGVTLT